MTAPAVLTVEQLEELARLLEALPAMTWGGCNKHPEHNSNESCWGIYSGEDKLRLLDVGQQLVALHNAAPALLEMARAYHRLTSALETAWSAYQRDDWSQEEFEGFIAERAESKTLSPGDEMGLAVAQQNARASLDLGRADASVLVELFKMRAQLHRGDDGFFFELFGKPATVCTYPTVEEAAAAAYKKVTP